MLSQVIVESVSKEYIFQSFKLLREALITLSVKALIFPSHVQLSTTIILILFSVPIFFLFV